jgi:hypothetical protein
VEVIFRSGGCPDSKVDGRPLQQIRVNFFQQHFPEKANRSVSEPTEDRR